MTAANLTEQQITRMAFLAVEIADRAAVADVECACVRDDSLDDGLRWLDLRPMLDEREHAPQSIDMARQAVDYLVLRHLAQRHPQHQHLLRITRHP